MISGHADAAGQDLTSGKKNQIGNTALYVAATTEVLMMYEELIHDLRLHHDTVVETYSKDGVKIAETIYSQAANAIEELSKPKWIPVTERLPEKEQCYLVVLKNRTVDFCFYTKRFGFGMYLAKKWESANDEVTHWMPLPEPPKEET